MLYLGSDTLFRWESLANSITGLAINDATLTGRVLNLNETALFSFSFTHETGTAGNYLGTVTATQAGNLEEDGEYIVEVTATSGTQQETRRERHTAGYREFD